MDEIDGVIDEHAIENGDYRDVYEMGGWNGETSILISWIQYILMTLILYKKHMAGPV